MTSPACYNLRLVQKFNDKFKEGPLKVTDFKISTDLTCNTADKDFPTEHKMQAIFFDKLAFDNTLSIEKGKMLTNDSQFVLNVCKGFWFGAGCKFEEQAKTVTGGEISLFLEPKEKYGLAFQFHKCADRFDVQAKFYNKPMKGVKLASTFTYDVDHSTMSSKIGAKYTVDDALRLRGLFDCYGKSDFIAKLKLNDNIKATLSTGLNMKVWAKEGRDATYLGIGLHISM